MGLSTGCVAPLLALMLVSSTAAGEDKLPRDTRVLGDRLMISLGANLVDLDSNVAAGHTLGAIIDLEDLLGLDPEIASVGLSGFWRFTTSGRQRLSFTVADYDRSASDVVSGTVPIFDIEFFGSLKSKFVNRYASLMYQYSLVNNGKTEAGLSAGLGTYKYDLSIEGEAVIDDEPDDAEFRSESVGIVAPVPVVGIYINQALRKNLVLEIAASAMDLKIGEHDGRILNTSVSLNWFFSRHVGAGVSISASDVDYRNDSDVKFGVNLRQNSLSAKFSAVF